MKRPNEKQQNKPRPPAQAPTTREWPAWARVLVSVLVVWHLAVVFVWPLSIGKSSNLQQLVAHSPVVDTYASLLHINNGYHFFAPNPPMNLLVRYRLVDATGAEVAAGTLPDLGEQWPRLWYHRHMMLADQAIIGPPEWGVQRSARMALRAYGRRLLRTHEDAVRAQLEYVEHRQLSPSEAAPSSADDVNFVPVDPNSPQTFKLLLSETVDRASLEEPLTGPVQPEQVAIPAR